MMRVLGILILVFAPAGLAVADAPASAPLPKWTVGDQWVYQRPDGKQVAWTVTGVESNGYAASVTLPTSPPRAVTVAVPVDLDWTALKATDGTFVQRDQGALHFPMTVGDTWNSTHPSVEDTIWQDTYTVAAYEKVTVPAGTFETFRIEGKESNLSKGTARSVVSGTGGFTVWYAPAVKWHVKMAWDTTPFWHPFVRGKQQLLVSYHVTP